MNKLINKVLVITGGTREAKMWRNSSPRPASASVGSTSSSRMPPP